MFKSVAIKSMVVVSMLLLSACASQQSRVMRKDVPDAEAAQDSAYCKMEAEKVQTADYAYRGSFFEGANIQKKQNETFALCLASKGYK